MSELVASCPRCGSEKMTFDLKEEHFLGRKYDWKRYYEVFCILPWLFQNGLLPKDLQDLSSCVKDDGDDGAHAGTLKKEDAEDLLEFTYAFLERLYTEPERLRLAKERRDQRRAPKS